MKNKVIFGFLWKGIVICASLLALCAFANPVSAVVNAEVVPSDTYVARGDTITVSVYLNSPSSSQDISSMDLYMYYDPAILTPVSITGVIPANSFTLTTTNLTFEVNGVAPDKIQWSTFKFGGAGLTLSSGVDTLIYTATFTVKTSATIGSSSVYLGPAGSAFVVNNSTTSVTGTAAYDPFNVVYGLASISLSSGTNYQGDLKSGVSITGSTGSDLSTVTQIEFSGGTGVSASGVSGSGTSASANIAIDASATATTYDVILKNSGGTPVAMGENMFSVTASSISCSPSSGNAGDTVPVTVNGTGTHFSSSNTTVNAGSWGTVSGLTVSSATQLSFNLLLGSSTGSKVLTVETTSVAG
ncbi:MAG: hypothetical protein WC636_05765, partial [Candidatus Margulisiibacteriota bacterium]